jgi:hypothetical protein
VIVHQLNSVEIVGNNFESGALGPGTIVGSAAFNLMCISAVCIVAIPGVESRKIKGNFCSLNQLEINSLIQKKK